MLISVIALPMCLPNAPLLTTSLAHVLVSSNLLAVNTWCGLTVRHSSCSLGKQGAQLSWTFGRGRVEQGMPLVFSMQIAFQW